MLYDAHVQVAGKQEQGEIPKYVSQLELTGIVWPAAAAALDI